MPTIAVSKFKATCLEVLQRVKRTGTPVLVTRFGVPVAEIVPPSRIAHHSWLGKLAGTGKLEDDLIKPVSNPAEWDLKK